jgi:uncharacterized protein YcfJ
VWGEFQIIWRCVVDTVLGKVLGDDSDSTVLGALIGGAIGTGITARNRGEEVTIPVGVPGGTSRYPMTIADAFARFNLNRLRRHYAVYT